MREEPPAESPVTYGPKQGYERSVDEPVDQRARSILDYRTIGLFLGVLLLQIGFIASYVGAFHKPQPHALSVTVVSHGNWQGFVANQLNDIRGQPLYAYASDDESQATADLESGKRQATYIFDPQGDTDILEVSSAQGASTAQALQAVFQQVSDKQSRKLIVRDILKAQPGDARGLTAFYLVVGWMVGGYLMATAMGIRFESRSRNFRRMLWRIGWSVLYSAVSGVMGALVVDNWLEALTGHFWEIAGIGFLITLSALMFSLGLEAIFGIVGIGVAIFIFVVMGNPSAGGAYSYALLPEPWRTLGKWLPNGAGVDALRSTVYQGGHGLREPLLILGWWSLAGLLMMLLVSNNIYWGRRRRAQERAAAEARADERVEEPAGRNSEVDGTDRDREVGRDEVVRDGTVSGTDRDGAVDSIDRDGAVGEPVRDGDATPPADGSGTGPDVVDPPRGRHQAGPVAPAPQAAPPSGRRTGGSTAAP